MVGAVSPTLAVPYTGPPEQQLVHPRPEQRVVEATDSSASAQPRTRLAEQPLPAALARLSMSARQFAAILETTGNIRFASTLSGFRLRGLDVYG